MCEYIETICTLTSALGGIQHKVGEHLQLSVPVPKALADKDGNLINSNFPSESKAAGE